MKAIILTLTLLGTSFAHADTKKTAIDKIETAFQVCAEKAMSTYEQIECSDTAYKAAGKELNRIYKTVLQTLKETAAQDADLAADSKESGKRLVKSEQDWLKYRDSNCLLRGTQSLGGSLENVIINGCLADTTIQRVKELQDNFGVN